MNKKTYKKMIDDALKEFEDMDVNYYGYIACLHLSANHGDYINKQECIRARERIETLKHFKELGLLK